MIIGGFVEKCAKLFNTLPLSNGLHCIINARAYQVQKGTEMQTLEQEREMMVRKLIDEILAPEGSYAFSAAHWDVITDIAEEIFALDIDIEDSKK